MKYKGMTVNERLYVSGLFDEYEKAEKSKDVKKLVQILKKVELVDESIKPIIENLGLTMR